jgi:DNA polymerase IV (DinB-like DNA polymerase)
MTRYNRLPARVIMLVDLDYFFAQCEELRNPSLKEKPIVVCVYSGRTTDSGAVSTANYAAREFGVKSGMPIYLAKKRLENVEAAFLPVDYEYYEEVSEKVMKILRGFADEFEQVGIDEAFLDVSKQTSADFNNAERLARTIKAELINQEKLTCSIGVAPNKLVAKICSDEKKPNGLTVINQDAVHGFLEPLPVNRLIGVGTKTLVRMGAMLINTVGDLAKCDVQKLTAVFGKALGVYFHNASLGIDDEPVEERGEAESISRIVTLKQNTRDLNAIMDSSNELCDDLHNRVINQNLTFKTVGIIGITIDLRTHTRSRTLDSVSNSLELMKKTVRELFGNFLYESEIDLRRVGVKLSNLSKLEENQSQITRFFEGN